MRTYTIHNARVLRVDRTRPDPNGHRGARLYAQEGVAGPLFILTIPGQLCPYDVEQMAGRIYRALSVRLNGVATHNGRLDAPPSELDDYHRFPVLEGTDDSGDARVAGGFLVDLFDLRPVRGTNRYRTTYGTKTKVGLARTVLALVTEEAGK